jgi:hypothetical protein
MHYGWGIEGIIGSNFKIDASFLSPNVNLASRVAGACNIYNTDLLISNTVY